MSSSSTSVLASTPEYAEQGVHQHQHAISDVKPTVHQHQSRSSSQGPVAILWDIENCPVPSDVRPEDVACNIRMALQVHPVIEGAITMFSAYGDFNAFPRRLREGCQRTGVKLVDVPNGRKDAADKAILVEMFLFALDNPPPSSIVLISGDVDFAPALHILGQRGYTVILVIPSGVGVSSALSNAGRFVWDWPSVARGEGFVPPGRPLLLPRSGTAEIAGLLMGCEINDYMDDQNEEESIVYRESSRCCYNMRDCSVPQSLSEYNSNSIVVAQNSTSARSSSLPCGLYETSGTAPASDEQNDLTWVQPGDLNGLKRQLVKLLELYCGSLPLIRLPAEYQKVYGRPLYVSEYGAFKLVNLLNKMTDAIAIEGKGQRRFVCLCSSKAGPTGTGPPVILARRDKKGNGLQEDSVDVITVGGSSDELSDDDRVVNGENDDRRGEEKLNSEIVGRTPVIDQGLSKFKYELQDILVSYSCRIFLGCFEEIYQQRYKRELDYTGLGVKNLEELLEKVSDVVVVQQDPTSKKKFLVASGG